MLGAGALGLVFREANHGKPKTVLAQGLVCGLLRAIEPPLDELPSSEWVQWACSSAFVVLTSLASSGSWAQSRW